MFKEEKIKFWICSKQVKTPLELVWSGIGPKNALLKILLLVQAKSLKLASVFLKEEKICYKMVYHTLHLS